MQTQRHTLRRKATLEVELRNALQHAQQLGYTTISAEDAFVPASHGKVGSGAVLSPLQQCPAVDKPKCIFLPLAELLSLTPEQQYVKKLATLNVYEALTARGGGAIIAGLDTTTGQALAVQVNDPSFLAKLQAALRRLRSMVGVQPDGPDWLPHQQEYQVLHACPMHCCRCYIVICRIQSASPCSDTFGWGIVLCLQDAADGLRTAMLRHTEIKVERHVSFLATLQEDRGAEVQSGHNTGLIRDK